MRWLSISRRSSAGKGSRHAYEAALAMAFLLMGFGFSITQVLVVRELWVSFAGNELSIGMVLAGWLLFEALGSAYLSRAVPSQSGMRAYAGLQILFALLLGPVLYLAFGARHLLGGVPGQGFGLLPMLLVSFALLMPLALVDGAMFTVGCRAYETARRSSVPAAGRVYILEAIGGVLGGVMFSLVLAPRVHAVRVALLITTLKLCSALSLVLLAQHNETNRPCRQRCAWAILSLATLSFVAFGTQLADRLHAYMAAWQWRGYELAYYGHSVYGNVAAIRQGEQLTFFENGVPILAAPAPDITAVEEMVHLPLLFVPQPRRALVLSGGLGGILHELQRYPLERIDYAELDPLLIEAVANLPTSLTHAELADPRLRLKAVDGRLLVMRTLAAMRSEGAVYDLILLNLPYPTTLQINRFYTVEFWGLVRGLLAEEGVAVAAVPGSPAHLSAAMRTLNHAMHDGLARSFAQVRPIPGERVLWLASPTLPLDGLSVDELVTRWQARAIEARLISPFYIRFKLDERQLARFTASYQSSARPISNRDLRPIGLLYGLAYWSELFSPAWSPFFVGATRLSFGQFAGGLAALAATVVAIMRARPGARTAALPILIGTTGFAGMTANLTIIFAFQVFYGYVYQLIGLLTTVFMVGLSLGAWLMTRAPDGFGLDARRWLLRWEGALLIFWLVLPGALALLHKGVLQGYAPAVVGAALLGLNACAGCLVGAQFPIANRLYLSHVPHAGRAAGVLYAADLLGGCLAALSVSVVLLPVLGTAQVCALIAILKVGSLVMVTLGAR